MVNYHTKEYINGNGPEWLFFRDSILRIARLAEVSDDDAYQIIFYLNDWFYHLNEELENGEASANAVNNTPKVISGLIKIFDHNYTNRYTNKISQMETQLENIKEKVQELSEIVNTSEERI